MLRNTLIMISAMALFGCGDAQTQESNGTAQTAINAPTDLFTNSRPPDAPGLAEVKKSASKGDAIRFMGRVGGKVEPFVSSSAVFVVADPSLISCELMGEEDHCAVPWDYCCEDADDVRNGIGTVRIVDGNGRPLRGSAENMGGLSPSKFVLIEGVLQDRNDEGLFIVDATKIWVGGLPNRANPLAGMR